jgi:CheY-like chemotaxis protein
MNKSVLSINGNKAMNYLLQTLLSKEYQFLAASNVFHGVHYLKTNRKIKALIIDLDFQPQQSWDLIEHIKTSSLHNVPVIVLVTENNETLRQKCYEYAVDEIFFKPFNPVDLIAAIRSTVEVTVAN